MPERIPELNDRVQLVERDTRDLAKSVSAVIQELGSLKDWRTTVNLTAAREDERDKALYRRLDEIEKSVEGVQSEARTGLKEIKGAAARVQWIVISAVIGVVITFVFKGGFS
jgi:hypothetical protein